MNRRNYHLSLFFIAFAVLSCSDNVKHKYYKNGAVKTEMTLDKKGLRQGAVTEYFDNGKIQSQYSCVNDTFEGSYKEYFPDGRLYLQTEFLKGKQNGQLLEYYGNGKLKQNSEYKMGKKNGRMVFYFQNGNKSFVGHGKDNITRYKIEYDSLGNIVDEQHLIEIYLLNKLVKTDSIKIKAKVYGFYNKDQAVFTTISKHQEIKKGLSPKMKLNPSDSCYYYTFEPVKSDGKYDVEVDFILDGKYIQRADTTIILER